MRLSKLHMLPMLLAVLLYGTGASFSLHTQVFHSADTAAHGHHHDHDSHAGHDDEQPQSPSDQNDQPLPSDSHSDDCATCSMLGGLASHVIASSAAIVETSDSGSIVISEKTLIATRHPRELLARGPPLG